METKTKEISSKIKTKKFTKEITLITSLTLIISLILIKENSKTNPDSIRNSTIITSSIIIRSLIRTKISKNNYEQIYLFLFFVS